MKQFAREVIAGLSTFFTMAYLLVLCPQLLSEGGLDFGSALTATLLTIAFSTFFLALISGYPIIVGPGLSVLTYLVFSVIGKGLASWPQTLGLVFWAGLTMLLLSLTRLRQKILVHLPLIIRIATPAGLGLFLIAIGLKQLQIIHIQSNGYSFGELGSAGQWIALSGLILFFLLRWKAARLAFLLPILFCWILSLLTGTAEWKGVFSLPPSLKPTWDQLDLTSVLSPVLWGPLFGIILVTLFDTGATLMTLTRLLGWVKSDGSIPYLNRVVIPDGVGSMLGAFLGTTNCAFYAESSSGICAGGKTAIVSGTTALLILGALFCFPALSSIPLFATAPVLIGLGILLAGDLRLIEWHQPTAWIPFLVTAVSMPLFFSIYWGFALGFLSFTLVKTLWGQYREVHPLVWTLTAIFALHIFFSL